MKPCTLTGRFPRGWQGTPPEQIRAFGHGQNMLFLHSSGQPALYACTRQVPSEDACMESAS